jgi:hypothetical protein
MVQCGGVFFLRIDTVEIFDAAVDPIIYGLIKAPDVGYPRRTFFAGNLNMRLMNNVTHGSAPFFAIGQIRFRQFYGSGGQAAAGAKFSLFFQISRT